MKDEAKQLRICELFRSIAGETTHAGLPATFVRLAGCNLRCRWCDTQKAWAEGRPVGMEHLLGQVLALPDRLVVVTGGEPLLQTDCAEFCRQLLAAGKSVLLETNGSIDIGCLPTGVRVILDMKPPGSGEHAQMDFDNLGRLDAEDELKFVIADREDFDWAVHLLKDRAVPVDGRVLFSPVMGKIEPRLLAQWIMAQNLPLRLQIQLHKVLWPDGDEGIGILT